MKRFRCNIGTAALHARHFFLSPFFRFTFWSFRYSQNRASSEEITMKIRSPVWKEVKSLEEGSSPETQNLESRRKGGGAPL